jgi:hypothetical protein
MVYQGKILRYLSNDKWYHGTTQSGWEEINRIGVQADYNRETSDLLDFGYGFYMTDKPASAENYMARLQKAGAIDSGEKLVVIEFEFCPLEWFESEDYKTRIFKTHDDEFAEFVYENRMKNVKGENQHRYDVIYGVMSDSNPIDLIFQHKKGVLAKEEVIEALKKPMSMKQISLHNQKLCDKIKITRVYEFETNESEIIRKEIYGNG